VKSVDPIIDDKVLSLWCYSLAVRNCWLDWRLAFTCVWCKCQSCSHMWTQRCNL